MPIRLPPIGFWSYARQDDEASEGRLSGLRAVLRAELQTQYGRESIMLFQDVAAIVPGGEWEAEIRNALNRSTFFIPIITPNFVESEWCMREVQLFLKREAELNTQYPDLAGRRRIFPIVYVPIDNADPFDPAIITELRKLQWFDFSNLRFKDHHDESVRAALSRLANSVCQLISLRVEDAETLQQRKEAEERREAEAKAAREAAAAEAQARLRAAKEAGERETQRREAEERARRAALERDRREAEQRKLDDEEATKRFQRQELPQTWRDRLEAFLFAGAPAQRKPKPAFYAAGGGVLVILLIAILALRPDPNATAKKALALVTDKDWSLTSSTDITTKVLGVATIQQMEALAQTGDVKAEAALGLAYYSGSNGIKNDNLVAGSWFHKAADKKFPRAFYNLGDAYAFGNGVPIDKAEAFTWFKLGADAGNALAQYQLGLAYEAGQGVMTDHNSAFKYMKLAADQGYPDAEGELGYMFHAGIGTAANEQAAVIWYRKAADQNVGVAEYNLGYKYDSGSGVAEDKARAAALYQRAMDHGYSYAGLNLGLLYWNGDGVTMDRTRARVLIKKAADNGNAEAKTWLVSNPEIPVTNFGTTTNYTDLFANRSSPYSPSR